MLAIAFLLCAAVLGIAIVRIVAAGQLKRFEELPAGVCVGWLFATGLAYSAARTTGALSFALMLWVAVIVAAMAIGAAARATRCDKPKPVARAEYFALGGLLAVFVPLFCVLFDARMLNPGAEGLYSGGTSQYDMAFHMALSTSFLYGQNFPPIYPVLPPEQLLYPPLPDFLTAALVAGGLSFHSALCLTGITLATAILTIFYAFAVRVIGSTSGARPHIAAVIATLLFLLNGGLGFLEFFRVGLIAERDLQWSNIIVDGFLPQRTSLFGFPAALLVFGIFAVAWWQWWNEQTARRWSGAPLLFAAGLLTAALPFFHTHSYLAVGLVSGFLFLLKPRAVWIVFWAAAVLPVTARLIALSSHLADGANLRFQPGWLGHGETNWALALVQNFGLPLLLIVPAWFAAPAVWRRFYLAFCALLIVALVFVISPNDTDNLKLIFYWYAPTCLLIGRWLATLATSHSGRLVAGILFAGCVTSAVQAIGRELSTKTLLFTHAEQDAADFAREHTPPNALFLTAPTLHQPMVSLAGRATVRGPTAWMWSHGYDFRAREADVRRIYGATADAAELLDHYAVDYIYLSDDERRDLRANEAFFDARFPAVYAKDDIKIYDVRGRSGRSGGRAHTPLPREFAQQVRIDPAGWLLEFPHMSYFVYRLWFVTHGRAPRRAECLADLETIGRGVSVGRAGWEAHLEQNKRELLKRRAATKSVDELAQAIEDPRLSRDEYDAAFVLMHFFGYLGRNPDDPPDNSPAGFHFWRAILQRTHDYRAVSRAFLESTEYKDRALEPAAVRP